MINWSLTMFLWFMAYNLAILLIWKGLGCKAGVEFIRSWFLELCYWSIVILLLWSLKTLLSTFRSIFCIISLTEIIFYVNISQTFGSHHFTILILLCLLCLSIFICLIWIKFICLSLCNNIILTHWITIQIIIFLACWR